MSVKLKPIYIKWNFTSSSPKIKELVEALYTDLNLGNLKVNTKKELLKTILLNLLHSDKIERGILYPRNHGWFQSIPSKYKYHFITYDLVINVVDALLKKEYIKNVMGEWDMQSKYKEQSCMSPSEKLLELYGHLINTDIIEFRPPVQEIVLRTKIYGEELNLKTDKKEKTVRREFLDYTDTAETNRMRKVVRDWNDLRSKTLLTLDIPKRLYDEDDDNERLTYYCDLSIVNEVIHCKVKPRGVYRTFVYNFDKFGRYSAGIETLIKRDYRSYFKINGEPTVELDFQALHIRMLYNMEGEDYQEDPYQVAANTYVDEQHRVRKYFKMIGLMAINAKTKPATIRSVVTKLKEEGIDIPYATIEKMLEHWLATHVTIAKYLCSGIGLKLMCLDSMVAEKVIQHFTAQEIMVLCVHDSFIISRKYEEELKSLMVSSYQFIMNVQFIPLIDRKYPY